MSERPSAILFDLDETILTFGRRQDQLLQLANRFASHGHGLAAETLARAVDARMTAYWAQEARNASWRLRPMDARRAAMAEVFAELAAAGARELTPEAAHHFADEFQALRERHIQPFPGALEALDSLRAAGFRLGLITNGAGEVQRPKIERFDLARRFDHVQVEGECGFGKPQPRAYAHALAALDTQAREAWIVGDNLDWEVATPQRLGLFAVWCDPYEVGLPPDSAVTPDLIIRSLTELAPAATRSRSRS
jgi:putative hydrolase of the HAD superfamily